MSGQLVQQWELRTLEPVVTLEEKAESKSRHQLAHNKTCWYAVVQVGDSAIFYKQIGQWLVYHKYILSDLNIPHDASKTMTKFVRVAHFDET